MPEAFSSVDIADMHLDCGNFRTTDSVSQGDTRMRVSSWIKYDPLAVALGQLGYFVNESPFMVGLEKIELHIWELPFQSACDVIQSASSIDLGIALSKAIEIWSIQDGYLFHD